MHIFFLCIILQIKTMQLTKNFKLEEFEVAHSAAENGFSIFVNKVPDYLIQDVTSLAMNLQKIRDEIKEPIKITSGYRMPLYNKKVGGSKGSYHTKGLAADLITDISPKDLKDVIEVLISKGEISQGGIGLYKTFLHYDIRGYSARW